MGRGVRDDVRTIQREKGVECETRDVKETVERDHDKERVDVETETKGDGCLKRGSVGGRGRGEQGVLRGRE